jgi:hypothetical protein
MVDVPAEGHNCSPHGDDSITLLRCQRRFWKDESFDGQGCRREHADLHLNTPLRGPFLELPQFLVTLGTSCHIDVFDSTNTTTNSKQKPDGRDIGVGIWSTYKTTRLIVASL